ncbi:MAG: TauD/TfdA family dioxygenase [Calothrix sp. MO_192.B10]|nr:TauD/TfdA family dioxygenase [Calothrix sp. MO_192.B10]
MLDLPKNTPKEETLSTDGFVTVDGKRFHYMWLYDHCLCPRCHDPSSFQKINDLCSRTTLPKPKSVEIKDEQLIINWDENTPHQSTFPVSWLLSRSYDPTPKQEVPSKKILWDVALLGTNPPECFEHNVCAFDSWMNQLRSLGFAVIRKMPWEELESFTSSIGPIYYLAQYGRYSTVKALPSGGPDLALSAVGHALSPHTDMTYMPGAPRAVQLLYCVENEASGGESILVDGFRVARDFRHHHPDYFRILSQTSATFRQLFSKWEYYVSQTTPIFKLDEAGEVSDVYFSHKNFGLNLPFDQVESFYEAYYALFRYLNNPTYQYCFPLEAGDCLLVQNFRVLHGRKAFNPSSGSRHLEVAFVEWNYFTGRHDFYTVKDDLYLINEN